MFSEELKYRLEELFVDNYFESSFSEFEFFEDAPGGEMKLNVTVGKSALGITGLDDSCRRNKNKPSKPKSKFIKFNNCADHVIIEIIDDKRCNVHIFEMKRSIGSRKWKDPVKKQFKGAYLQCCSITACLGIIIEETIFYTVYENDKFYSENLDTEVDPKRLYVEHGDWRPEPKSEWKNGEVFLKFGKFKKFKHEKINAEVKTGYPFPQAEYNIP